MAKNSQRTKANQSRNERKAQEYANRESGGSTTTGSRYRERVAARGYPTVRMCDHVRTASGPCQHDKEERKQSGRR